MNPLLLYAVSALALALAGLTTALWHRARTAQEAAERRARDLEALEARHALLQSEQVDLLELLRELPQLTAGPDSERRLRDIPEILLRALVRIFQPGEAMVFLRRRATSDQPERSSQLILTATQAETLYAPGQVIEIGEGPIGRLAECAGPTRGSDLPGVGDQPRIDLGTPMMHGDQTLGVITLTDLGRQRSYDESLLWLLASLGAYALESHFKLSQVRTVAELDPLTQLYNRAALSLRLAQEVLKCESDGGELSVFLFDLDDFKAYNESNGHLAGDELLRQVARFVSERIRAEDIFGRFSGQQFLIILPNRSTAEAETAAENIRSAIARRDFLFGERQPKGRITISGGIASAPADAAGSAELLKAVEGALVVAKESGRNQIAGVSSAADEGLASVVG